MSQGRLLVSDWLVDVTINTDLLVLSSPNAKHLMEMSFKIVIHKISAQKQPCSNHLTTRLYNLIDIAIKS